MRSTTLARALYLGLGVVLMLVLTPLISYVFGGEQGASIMLTDMRSFSWIGALLVWAITLWVLLARKSQNAVLRPTLITATVAAVVWAIAWALLLVWGQGQMTDVIEGFLFMLVLSLGLGLAPLAFCVGVLVAWLVLRPQDVARKRLK